MPDLCGNNKRELPTPGGSPFLFALCLPLRSPRSGFVPLHGFLFCMNKPNIQKLCDYINQQEDPEWFMQVLFALVGPKKEAEKK